MRLKAAIKAKYPHLPLTTIADLILAKEVRLGHKIAKTSDSVTDLAAIQIDAKHLSTQLQAVKHKDVVILKETNDFLFVHKPSGLHSVAQNFSETQSVANALLATHPELAGLNPLECGLAHRLDFLTSGVMVAAKNKNALQFLRDAFKKQNIEKIYRAVVANYPPPIGLHKAFALTGRKSAAKVKLSLQSKNQKPILTEVLRVTKIECPRPDWQQTLPYFNVTLKLITGHRHQIRAHLALLGSALAGDALYGSDLAAPFLLCAERLAFVYAGERLVVESPSATKAMTPKSTL